MKETLYLKRFDTGTVCDVTEDFTLPDYQPEIRRVIGVVGNTTSDGKYLSGDEIEVDGGVTFTVLYVGGDGGLYQTSQTSSYTGRISAKSEDDRFTAGDIVLSCSTENISCRVTGPRKITLSARVKLGIMSQKPFSAGMKADGNVRRKTETHKCACLSELRHSSDVSGEMREREGLRLVMARGEICIYDVRIADGIATVKGDAFVCALLCSDEGEYVTSRGRAPLEDEIQIPDGMKGEVCTAASFATPVMLEMESGENGEITWRMEYDIDCDIMRCDEAEITTDAYLTDSEDELTMSEYEVYYPAGCANGRLTVTTSMKQKPDMKPICAWGVGVLDKCEISRGRMSLTGGLKLSIVNSGNGDVSLDEVSLPFKYECDAGNGAPDTEDQSLTKKMSVSVTDIQTRCDGDKLNITAELGISAVAMGRKRIKCAESIVPAVGATKNREKRSGNNVIRIYSPGEGETPWDVEKRFKLGYTPETEGEFYIV